MSRGGPAKGEVRDLKAPQEFTPEVQPWEWQSQAPEGPEGDGQASGRRPLQMRDLQLSLSEGHFLLCVTGQAALLWGSFEG